MRHQQLTDELQERAMLYAAGALDEPERTEYSRHLQEDDCAVCIAEVLESEAAAQSLAMMLPTQTPSASVKQRLLERVEATRATRPEERPRPFPEPRRTASAWGGWLAAAAALAVAGVLLGLNLGLRQEVKSLNAQIMQLESRVSAQNTLLVMATSPRTKVVNLAGLKTPQARGRIFVDEGARLWRFYVEDLPTAPANRAYQLWAVPDGAKPVSAVVFNTDANGTSMLELPAPMVAGMLTAAVTEEPELGSPQPTTLAFNLAGKTE